MNAIHLQLISDLFAQAEDRKLPLWLESGWAIDARLHRVTREHEDIDLAFPEERLEEFLALLQTFGCGQLEETDYGFLVYVREVLLDCEPCLLQGDQYELKDAPVGSCPWNKQGALAGVSVRCTSWEAIFWEYLYYLDSIGIFIYCNLKY